MPTIVTWLRRIGIAAAVIIAPFALFTATLFVLPAIFVAVAAAIVAAVEWLSENIGSIWDSIVTTISDAWDSIVAFLMPGIEFVVGLFVLLGRAIAFLSPVFAFVRIAAGAIMAAWARVRPFFAGLWSWISSTASSAMGALAGPMQGAVDTVRSIWGGLSDFFTGLWRGIAASFQQFVGPGLDLAGRLLDRLGGAVGGAVDEVREEGRGAMGTGARSMAGMREERRISETTRTERAEVTIRDQTGRAQTTRPQERRGSRIRLQPSGDLMVPAPRMVPIRQR
jgi:hypothetical protein